MHVVQDVIDIPIILNFKNRNFSKMVLYVVEEVIDIFGRHLKQIQLLSENSGMSQI